MKRMVLAAVLCIAFASVAGSQGIGSNPNNHYVNPYVTPRGTPVPGHYQTNPNQTPLDNYGTRPNVNPYTGAVGNRLPRQY